MVTPRILAVVVIYGIDPAQSAALKRLKGDARIAVMVYDNTEGRSASGPAYYAAGENRGVAGAYNFALEQAADGYDWLLLLDQDTELPEGFAGELIAAVSRAQPDTAAVVPVLEGHGRQLSPYREWLGAFARQVTAVRPGQRIVALNSGACVRIAKVRAIGGFSRGYPLDCCDFDLFHRLQQAGGRVEIARAIRLRHTLSLRELATMPTLRYERLLEAHSRYIDEHQGRLGRALYTARLVARAANQYRRGYGALAALTLASARKRAGYM